MPTLAEENRKILRRALDVIVGMDIPFEEISSVSASGNYAGSSGIINASMQRPILMDLSDGGFLNDGLAISLGSDTDGFVSEIGTDLVLSVTLDNANDDDLVVIGYVGGVMHKWTFSGSGANRTVTIPANSERIIVNRIICGQAFWFDNASLISCNLQLRSVDTKVYNPELQMSEIEIEGYELNDITNVIGYIGTGYPIYYTSGYPGDMSQIRQFYMGEQIEFDDHIVKIKGYDGTYKLDNDYVGFCFYPSGLGDLNGGIVRYTNEIDNILTNADVPHTYEMDPDYTHVSYFSGPLFIDKQPKREVIANAVNLFRTENDTYPYVLNYVDAGIPRLWTGKDTSGAVTLEHISKPTVIVDPAIKSLALNVYDPVVRASAVFETIESLGAAFYETSEPYYSMSASSGTLTYIGPYDYKLNATGSINISGRLIQFVSVNAIGYGPYLPLIETSGTGGVDIELADIYTGTIVDAVDILQTLIQRSNISYEFDYRGDPNLQPRDYIRADIDGSGTLVDMTIDTIELKHEGGGTTSTILARRGFI